MKIPTIISYSNNGVTVIKQIDADPKDISKVVRTVAYGSTSYKANLRRDHGESLSGKK